MLRKRILSILSEKKSLDHLISNKLTYAQISVELLKLLNDKYIYYEKDRFIITDLGKKALSELSKEKIKELKIKSSPQISLDDIYIPNYIKEP